MTILAFIVVGILVLFDKNSNPKYIGVADGYEGPIKVSVTLDKDKVSCINILESAETPTVGGAAFDIIIPSIIKNQSVAIDDVAGATTTSTGVKTAVVNALNSANLKLEKFNTDLTKVENNITIAEPQTAPIEEVANSPYKDAEVVDVIIVGGGGAGLTAAIAATEKGAHVVLLEKMPLLGGNTTYSTGGMNAANTEFQKKAAIEDSEQLFYDDTMKGGQNKNNPELVKTLTDNAKFMIPWLIERGMDFTDVGQFAGASVKRIHRPAGGKAVGPVLVKTLIDKATALNIDIRTENKLTKLLKEEGKIVGVEVDNNGYVYKIFAKAIVMATGGFGANPEMVTLYDPALKGFGSTNSRGITGEGIKIVNENGGQLVDMELIQTHPTVVHKNTVMITEAVRGEGAIVVNRAGKRFVSEMATRDVMSKAILNQDGGSAFLIFEQNVRERLKATIDGYLKGKYVIEGATIEELGKNAGINDAELANTIKIVNEYVTAGEDTEFKSNALKTNLSNGPFYAIEISPAVHHTMGGVKISSSGEVLDAEGVPIPGLFAAGEITGGVHGANRLGGNAVADIIVFGKIAGDNAADFAKNKE
ncbi:MAG: flavocytochrome c [Fusobacteriaceae bacterium]|nr:flavocytochrome c [Fusobacteriaceae bacterium]